MDGKEESLCTELATLFWVCIKPPDKAVSFLIAKKTTHTN